MDLFWVIHMTKLGQIVGFAEKKMILSQHMAENFDK